MAQRVRHLQGHAERVGGRQLLLAREPLPERLALHVRHDVVAEPVGSARDEQAFGGRQDRHDVRVIELRSQLHLADEPLAERGRAHVGVHHLDRHPAGRVALHREVDRGHPASADLALDRIVGSQALSQGLEYVDHRGAKGIPGP